MTGTGSGGSGGSGIGCIGTIGIILAAIISYSINGSLGWAIFHGFLNWFYVIYQFVIGFRF